METIRFVVERITYQNPENGYSVLKVNMKDYRDLVTVVGTFGDLFVGAVLLCEGYWTEDKKYGRQFKSMKWEEVLPATAYGIEKYLGSGMIRGIGPKYASRIVQKFGTDTIDIIDNQPEKLLEIPGIGKERLRRIRESWEQQKEVKNIMIFLQNYGVSTAFATKIFKTYGNDSIRVVRDNPFRLADDIWGIGFKTADALAEKMGWQKDDPQRCRSGLFYTLNQLSEDGHVYATREQLTKTAAELLEVDPAPVEAAVDLAISQADLMEEDGAVYLPVFYHAEKGVADKLLQILHAPVQMSLPHVDFDSIQRDTGIAYDDIQKMAITTALTQNVVIITGGPGTGKTTITRGILQALQQSRQKVLLAAPTGRAAKRLSEATGKDARTIHRLLEFKPPHGYERNADHPLDGDVLIVDEASMIDIILMNALLNAVPEEMKLVIVGDTDQLPSVGPGNVLRDMIESDVIPVVRLTRIFRQAQKSRIVMNAHRINEGNFPNISNGRESDFFFLEQEDPEAAAEEIVNLIENRLPRAYGVSPFDIQILTPMQRGVIGAAALNTRLQQLLNPQEQVLHRGGIAFGERDKVMQIRNNYDKDVYNGDIGTVTKVDLDERLLYAEFDGRVVSYEVSELNELVLAYATTVHKSQGSEYPIVIMPIMMSHFVMLQRNLIYTGITRAKRIMILVGQKKALAYCIHNLTVDQRNSRLRQRLQEKRMAQ